MRRPAQDPALSDARGYAMAVLLVGIAVMLVLMTVAMPVWRQQQKREREEELLFRLKQYAHALALYQRKLPGAAPTNVEELVKQRFLRKKYLDPMTGKDFAVLRVGQVSPGMTSPLPGQVETDPRGTTRPGTPSARPPSTGLDVRPGGGPTSPGQTQPGGLGAGGMSTGAIRGVVSTSKDSSLRAWKGRTQYDQWEVAIEDITPRNVGPQAPQPGQNQRPGAGPGRPGQGAAGPGGTRPTSPGQLPANPYGSTIRP